MLKMLLIKIAPLVLDTLIEYLKDDDGKDKKKVEQAKKMVEVGSQVMLKSPITEFNDIDYKSVVDKLK